LPVIAQGKAEKRRYFPYQRNIDPVISLLAKKERNGLFLTDTEKT
jgi:hypothetical protein